MTLTYIFVCPKCQLSMELFLAEEVWGTEPTAFCNNHIKAERMECHEVAKTKEG